MAYYMLNNNSTNKTEKYTIAEWELQTGMKIVKAGDCITPKNKIYTKLYTKKAFKRLVQNSVITCKTNKGLEFLNSLVEEEKLCKIN